MTLTKSINYLLALFLFALPWQTRWIYSPQYINGTWWEYGTRSLYATELLLVVIILLFVVAHWKEQRFLCFPSKQCSPSKKLSSKKNWLAVVLLLTIGLVSIFHSLAASVSAYFIFHLLEGCGLFLILAYQNNGSGHEPRPTRLYNETGREQQRTRLYYGFGRDSQRTSLFLMAWWLGGVVQGVLALVQFFTQYAGATKWLGLALHTPDQAGVFVIETAGGRWLRAYGSFGSPNILGGYLAILLVVGFIIVWLVSHEQLTSKSRPFFGALTIGQLIIFSGLIVSFSRGAWLAAVVGFITIIVLISSIKKTKTSKITTFVNDVLSPTNSFANDASSPTDSLSPIKKMTGWLLLPLIFFIFFTPMLFYARVTATGRLETKSFTTRMTEYQEWWNVFVSHPFFGVGPGAYTPALYLMNPLRAGWDYQPVHNVYLLMLAEFGLVGLALTVYGSSLVIRKKFLVNLARFNPLCFSIFIVILTLGLFDHWWWTLSSGQLVVWVALGITRPHFVDKW